MSNFPRLINVTGQGSTGNITALKIQTPVPKQPPTQRKYSAFVVNVNSSRIQTQGNTQLFPAGITIAANGFTNINTYNGTIASTYGAGEINAVSVGIYGNTFNTAVTQPGNSATHFIVHLEPSSTANTRPPNTSLTKVITIAPAGNDGSNTYGGYREWFTSEATVSTPTAGPAGARNSLLQSTANGLVYRWTLTGNTNLPWQFNNYDNSGADFISNNVVTNVTVIYCY